MASPQSGWGGTQAPSGGGSASGWGGTAAPVSAAPAKSGGGGILGGITHFVGRTASDLESAAINTIPGVYKLAKDVVAPGTHPSWSTLGQEWSGLLHHPLRHPGYTAEETIPCTSVLSGSCSAWISRSGWWSRPLHSCPSVDQDGCVPGATMSLPSL